jgi:diguanylate cyclase (GGDEF)-like protein
MSSLIRKRRRNTPEPGDNGSGFGTAIEPYGYGEVSEEERADEDRRLAAVVRVSRQMTTILSDEGLIEFQSTPSGELLGYEAENMVGVSFVTLVSGEDVYRWEAAFEKVVSRTGFDVTGQWSLRRSDGTLARVHSTLTNLLHDPSIAGVVVLSRLIGDVPELAPRPASAFPAVGAGPESFVAPGMAGATVPEPVPEYVVAGLRDDAPGADVTSDELARMAAAAAAAAAPREEAVVVRDVRPAPAVIFPDLEPPRPVVAIPLPPASPVVAATPEEPPAALVFEVDPVEVDPVEVDPVEDEPVERVTPVVVSRFEPFERVAVAPPDKPAEQPIVVAAAPAQSVAGLAPQADVQPAEPVTVVAVAPAEQSEAVEFESPLAPPETAVAAIPLAPPEIDVAGTQDLPAPPVVGAAPDAQPEAAVNAMPLPANGTEEAAPPEAPPAVVISSEPAVQPDPVDAFAAMRLPPPDTDATATQDAPAEVAEAEAPGATPVVAAMAAPPVPAQAETPDTATAATAEPPHDAAGVVAPFASAEIVDALSPESEAVPETRVYQAAGAGSPDVSDAVVTMPGEDPVPVPAAGEPVMPATQDVAAPAAGPVERSEVIANGAPVDELQLLIDGLQFGPLHARAAAAAASEPPQAQPEPAPEDLAVDDSSHTPQAAQVPAESEAVPVSIVTELPAEPEPVAVALDVEAPAEPELFHMVVEARAQVEAQPAITDAEAKVAAEPAPEPVAIKVEAPAERDPVPPVVDTEPPAESEPVRDIAAAEAPVVPESVSVATRVEVPAEAEPVHAVVDDSVAAEPERVPPVVDAKPAPEPEPVPAGVVGNAEPEPVVAAAQVEVPADRPLTPEDVDQRDDGDAKEPPVTQPEPAFAAADNGRAEPNPEPVRAAANGTHAAVLATAWEPPPLADDGEVPVPTWGPPPAVEAPAACWASPPVPDQTHGQGLRDPITGLVSWALFRDRLDQAVARAERTNDKLAVILVDLGAGEETVASALAPGDETSLSDEVLRAIGSRLASIVRVGDTVARFDRSRFGIFPDASNSPNFERLGARIFDALRGPLIVDGVEVLVKASIGMATTENGFESAGELLAHTEIALQSAKASGSDCFENYEAGFHGQVVSHPVPVAETGAFLRNEMTFHYQPIFELVTGSMVRVEALLRWNHPRRGLVMPAEFLPIAEQSGQIRSLASWAIPTACREARHLQLATEMPSLGVAVNISRQEFDHPSLVDVVAAALSESGLAPGLLTIEIAESALLSDAEGALPILESLRGLGVQVSVDDFGTGHSSLADLGHLPVDELKIDPALVAEVAVGGRPPALLAAVASLASSLGLRTVAEGIETEVQLAYARQAGCVLAQGYLLGRPTEAQRLNRLIARDARVSSFEQQIAALNDLLEKSKEATDEAGQPQPEVEIPTMPTMLDRTG